MVNWLWLGKCHVALGNHKEATHWLKKAARFQTTLEEEIEVGEGGKEGEIGVRVGGSDHEGGKMYIPYFLE